MCYKCRSCGGIADCQKAYETGRICEQLFTNDVHGFPCQLVAKADQLLGKHIDETGKLTYNPLAYDDEERFNLLAPLRDDLKLVGNSELKEQ